jgi:hypothetical protein
LSVKRELLARGPGHNADGTSDRVPPEQRALRTLQDLDSLHVQQVLIRADRARIVHAVYVDTHARIEVEREVILADAANRRGKHRIGAREGCACVQVHVRGEPRKAIQVGNALVTQVRFRECRDGNGYRLNVLGAFLSGDHDLFQLTARRRTPFTASGARRR